MPYTFGTDLSLAKQAPRYPRLLGESSTAVSFTADDALAWAKEIRDCTLNFTEDKRYEDYVAGVDPFTRAEDGKYLVYLADDGTLKEMIPAERRGECLNNPEFCRQMATLSQEGRLFMRKPGQGFYRQIDSRYVKAQDDRGEGIDIYQVGGMEEPLNLQPREIPAPVAPKAPSRWKYLLYIFSKSIRDEFKQYNEDKQFFEENYDRLLEENRRYAENLAKSLRQLDDCGLDADALKKEAEQQRIVKEQWKDKIKLEATRNTMRERGLSDEQIRKYETAMQRHTKEKTLFQEVKPLQFESEEQMLLIAYHAYTDQKLDQSYMDALNNMNGGDLVLKADSDLRAHIVLRCLHTNITELKKCTADDPKHMKLLQMNEALLEYAKTKATYSPLFKHGDDDVRNLEFYEERHKSYKNIFSHRGALLDQKESALSETLTHKPNEKRNLDEVDNIAAAILTEALKVIDANQMATGSLVPNPIIVHLGSIERGLDGILDGMKETPAFQELLKLSGPDILDFLTDRKQVLGVAEKIFNDSKFQRLHSDIQLVEQMEEAKANEIYGDKSTLNGPKIDEFKERLQDASEIETTITIDIGISVDSYCKSIAQTLEKQLAGMLLKAVDKVPEAEKNVYLVRFRKPFELITSELKEFVENSIDEDRINAVIEEGHEEGYEKNPERKAEIDQEIRDMVQNGLMKYCEYSPDFANALHLQKVIRQPQVKQSAPQLQQVQQQMQQPEPQPKPAAAPGL